MTKDYRIQIRIKNNYLHSLMKREGFKTIKELAAASGVLASSISSLANLRVSTMNLKDEWRPWILRIADALRCMPEDLAPAQHHKNPLSKNRGELELSLEELTVITDSWRVPLPSPDILIEQADMKDCINAALSSLKAKERDLIIDHYGLNDAEPLSHAELSRREGVSREGIRQIIARGLRKLKHPSRVLRGLYEDATWLDERT